MKIYNQEHKKETKIYYQLHKKEIKEYAKKYQFDYQASAKQRNLNFNLSYKEFITFWQKPCVYCGCKIKTIGIDRIDSKKGYLIDNVVACCKTCNWMKLAMTKKEFINKCRKIIKYNNLKI